MLTALLWIGGFLVSGLVVGYLMGGAAKLGGEEDPRRESERES